MWHLFIHLFSFVTIYFELGFNMILWFPRFLGWVFISQKLRTWRFFLEWSGFAVNKLIFMNSWTFFFFCLLCNKRRLSENWPQRWPWISSFRPVFSKQLTIHYTILWLEKRLTFVSVVVLIVNDDCFTLTCHDSYLFNLTTGKTSFT